MTAYDRLQRQLVAALRSAMKGDHPRIPDAGQDIWKIFCDLSSAREYSMAGPQALSHGHILSYVALHRWPLQPHHIEIIRALDTAWLEHARSKNATKTTPAATAKRTQTMNPAMFDALFG